MGEQLPAPLALQVGCAPNVPIVAVALMRLPMASQLHSWQIGESYQGYPSGHRQGCLIESPGWTLSGFSILLPRIGQGSDRIEGKDSPGALPELPMHRQLSSIF